MLRMLVRDGDSEGWATVGSHHHLESEGPKGGEATAIVQMGTRQELWLSGGQPHPNCGHAGKEQGNQYPISLCLTLGHPAGSPPPTAEPNRKPEGKGSSDASIGVGLLDTELDGKDGK